MKNLYAEISTKLPITPLHRFLRLLSSERAVVWRVYLYGILAGLIGLSLPLGIQALINLVSTGTLTTSWYVLIVVIVGGLLIGGVMQILQLIITEAMQQRIFSKAAIELAIRIPRLQEVPLRDHYVPELVNRFFDTVTVQKGLAKLLLDFSASSLQIAFGLILLAFYHPAFILFGLGLVLTLVVIVRITAPMGLLTSLQESKFKYEVAHWLEETGRNRELFKPQKAGDFALRETDKLTMNYLGARKKHFTVLMSKYIVLLVFKVLIITGLLIIGSILVVENLLNLGQFVAVEIVTILVISSVDKVVLSVETIYDVLTGLEKIGFITDIPLEPAGQTGAGKFTKTSEIRFEKFVLTSPNNPEPELEVPFMRILPGERVLIDGGDPQSWHRLSRVLSGDFQTYSGLLSVGGVPVRDWDRNLLRAKVGVYHGARSVIDASILENVTLNSGPVPMAKISEIAAAIGLDAYIQHEPESWNKQAGPEGIWIPHHARSKIMLAQLLMSEPKIMLLSDFDHNVDEEIRKRFWDYVEEKLPDSTIIVTEMKNQEGEIFDQEFHFSGTRIEPMNPGNSNSN